jgi:glycosyltransferase involved in cell wall biosynthesis
VREPAAANPSLAFPLSLSWVPRVILKWSDCVIVNSVSLRNTLFGNGTHDKVRVIHNGVALNAPAPVPADLAQVPAGARLTAICGGLSPHKGIHVYLDALARLQDSHPEAHHLVIGRGHAEYEAALQKQVERLGLTGRVHFLGARADVRALLSRCAILVSASLRESFGRTLIEAMALGVPVVATKSGGPEEIIEDGKSGFLVAVADADALAERMSRLLSDRGLAAAMGKAGQERVERCFDLDKTVASVEKVFAEALAPTSNAERRA